MCGSLATGRVDDDAATFADLQAGLPGQGVLGADTGGEHHQRGVQHGAVRQRDGGEQAGVVPVGDGVVDTPGAPRGPAR